MKKILVLVSVLFSGSVFASCDLAIEAKDPMVFSVKQLVASKSCKTVKVTVKNIGVLEHNWVLTETSMINTVGTKGAQAGPAKNYVDQASGNIIAYSKVLKKGQSSVVTVDMSKLKAGKSYSFLCSVPGHFLMMKGSFKVK